MSGPLEGPFLDAVRTALTYAPIGVADAARHELAELTVSSLVVRLAQLQAERDELFAYGKDAFWTLEAIVKHEPDHLLDQKALANQFLLQHARTSAKVLR